MIEEIYFISCIFKFRRNDIFFSPFAQAKEINVGGTFRS
jgi:hypothetical protein